MKYSQVSCRLRSICTSVFADHHFHSEKADLKNGSANDRKVYEGQLSDNDWNALLAVIDSPSFRDLKMPATVPPLVMQDTHPYTISVARDGNFQNMEFLDNKRLKPYEATSQTIAAMVEVTARTTDARIERTT